MTTCTLVIKFPLRNQRNEIPVQVNDRLLAVGMDLDHGEEVMVAWFEVNKAETHHLRPSVLYVVHTGELLPEPGLVYVATVNRFPGRPALHVFERRDPKPVLVRTKTPAPPWAAKALRLRRGWLWLHAMRRRPKKGAAT